MRLMFAALSLAACSAPSTAHRNTPFDGAPDAAVDSTLADATGDAAPDALDAPAPKPFGGINLPPTQGTSNAGAFLPGVYAWDYAPAQLAAFAATFDIVRIPVNTDTANSPAALATLQGIVDQLAGQRAILCFFGTDNSGSNSHGTGVIDDMAGATQAWANIDAVFDGYPNVHYEILNEPFGYAKSDPATYVSQMTAIIAGANLPPDKCILDGMGYADDIQLVASAGWTGDLGYHFYPNWTTDHTQPTYSNLAQAAIGSLGPRTWITEFGANLGFSNECYQTFEDGNQPSSADVNTLRGLDDAVGALKASGNGIHEAISWHGWDNGDSYDFWSAADVQGACKIRLIQSDS